MKVGDLVRYDPGSTWTEQQKKDNCAFGVVIKISYRSMSYSRPSSQDSVLVKWVSHTRDDASWETANKLELISENR